MWQGARLKFWAWLFVAMFMLLVSRAYAQSLPAGSIGTVNQTTTYTYQLFNYSFTASASGANYIGLAFRQDPGYWSVGSLSLTAQNSTTNLLTNGNLQYGGSVSGYGIQAPANWGVWYQTSAGAPPAAGTWYAPGTGWMGSTTDGLGVNTATSGSWIDGAVGAYDGIYQGFNATAGRTYNFSFYSAASDAYYDPSIMIGVYTGLCGAGQTMYTCTPANSPFTAQATPQDTQGTGGAPPPPPPPSSGPVFTDLKFSGSQIADTQWNVGSCTNAGGTNCQIYSKAPGPTWNTGSPVYPSSTQYIAFTASGNATYPWHMYLYNSDGSVAQDLGIGKILSQGLGTDGHHYFFFSNANYNGTLFSTDWGMNNTSGLTINGTNSPTVQQTNEFASTGSTSPLAAGQSSGSTTPTVVSTLTTNTVTTTHTVSTIYDLTRGKTLLRFANNGQLNSYNDSVRSRIFQIDDTTTTTPSTTTTYSDGSSTTTQGSASSATVTTYDYEVDITRGNTATYRFTLFNGNSVYIDQKPGSANNNVTIEQAGPMNAIVGSTGSYATLSGQSNTVYMRQGSASGPNLIQFGLVGNSNTLAVNQGYNPGAVPAIANRNLGDSGGHIGYFDISGNNNNVGAQQTNDGGVGSGHYVSASVSGNFNTVSAQQINNGAKETYVDISGNYNSVGLSQKGLGQHYADISVLGNSNVINLTQDSANAKYATINAVNAGGVANITVSQTGSSAASIVVNQVCTTGTCGVNVSQVK